MSTPLHHEPIPFITLTNWVKAAAQCGFNIEPVFREVGIEMDLIHLESATVNAPLLQKVMEACVARNRDPAQHFPFVLGETFAFDYLPDIDTFLATSPTLRDGLRVFDWVRELINPMIQVHLDEVGDEAHLVLTGKAAGEIRRPARGGVATRLKACGPGCHVKTAVRRLQRRHIHAAPDEQRGDGREAVGAGEGEGRLALLVALHDVDALGGDESGDGLHLLALAGEHEEGVACVVVDAGEVRARPDEELGAPGVAMETGEEEGVVATVVPRLDVRAPRQQQLHHAAQAGRVRLQRGRRERRRQRRRLQQVAHARGRAVGDEHRRRRRVARRAQRPPVVSERPLPLRHSHLRRNLHPRGPSQCHLPP